MTRKHRLACLAKVHIAVAQLGLDDDAYRTLLHNLFARRDPQRAAKWAKGKPSAAHLTAGELGELLHHFKDRGFRAVEPARAKKQQPAVQRGTREAYLGKINALLAEAGRGWPYAHAIARQMWGIQAVHWLNDEQLRGVVAALAKDARRHKREEAG